jgi:hypothetical protein
MALAEHIALYILVTILAGYVVVCEFLDLIGRLEIVETKWPKLWGFMSNRPMRLVLIVLLLVLIGRDVVERIQEPPQVLQVVIQPPPPPNITFAPPEREDTKPSTAVSVAASRPPHKETAAPSDPLDTPVLHAGQEDITSDRLGFYEKKVTVNAKQTMQPFNLILNFDPSIDVSGFPNRCLGYNARFTTEGDVSDKEWKYFVTSSPVTSETPIVCFFYSTVPFKLVSATLEDR